MTIDIAARMQELTVDRVPFVHAVVVRTQVPTSVYPGDDAIVLPDGSIEGFVGGQCAEVSVRAAALGALRDGQAVLLRVLPEDALDFPESPGAQVVVNPCLSGGALEIFLRPLLPPPVLAVAGGSPVAQAVAELARGLDFTVRSDDLTDASAVLIASHGHGEAAVIRAALEAGAGYIGLVASRRRGAAVLAELELSDAERAVIHTPAGLPIGARTASEIALSILAEIVSVLRKATPTLNRGAAGRPGLGIREAVTAVDPVCGMTVVVGPDTPHLVEDGRDVWFCGPGCLRHHAERG